MFLIAEIIDSSLSLSNDMLLLFRICVPDGTADGSEAWLAPSVADASEAWVGEAGSEVSMPLFLRTLTFTS